MAEEIPQTSPEDEAAKAETIRITLPTKGEALPQKRETVRINLPGRPAELSGSGTSAPKKETTKIAIDGGGAPPPPPAPAAAKPFLPPPTGAKPSAPPPPRPLGSGVAAPPKPPSLSARPTAPLKPAPAAPSGLARPAAPSAAPGAAPKKETARITLPPEGAKPAGMPKATVKMQQTQPLARQPSTIQSTPVIQQAALSMSAASEGPDSGTTIMSIAAFVFSLVALGLSFWAYSASGVQ